MNHLVKKMFDIAQRYNQALTLESKRQLATEVDKLHSEMVPVYMEVIPENGYSEALCDLSMELLLDIRMGRRTSVDKKVIELN